MPEWWMAAAVALLILTQAAWTKDRAVLAWLPAATLMPALWVAMNGGWTRYLGVFAALAAAACWVACSCRVSCGPAWVEPRTGARRLAWGLLIAAVVAGAWPTPMMLPSLCLALAVMAMGWRVCHRQGLQRRGRLRGHAVLAALWWIALASGVLYIGVSAPEDALASAPVWIAWPVRAGLLAWVADLWMTLAFRHRQSMREARRRIADVHRFDLQVSQLRTRAVLEDGERKVREAIERRREFLATMSHELRTPISCIAGMSRLIASALDNDEILRKDMGTIERLAVQLINTVDSGLAFVRREPGEQLRNDDVRMRWLLRDMRVVGEWLASQNQNAFEFFRFSDVPSRLFFDEQRLRQILINLLSNAARYCQGGRVTLSLRFLAEANGPTQLVWYVEDTGRGMSDTEMKKYVQPFVKSRDSTGLGLGLSLVQRMVTEMGGQIDIRSRQGQGTKIKVLVPVRLEREDAAEMVADERIDVSNIPSGGFGHSVPLTALTAADARALQLDQLRTHIQLGQVTDIEGWVTRAKSLSGLGTEAQSFVAKVDQASQVLDLQQIAQLLDQFDSPASFI